MQRNPLKDAQPHARFPHKRMLCYMVPFLLFLFLLSRHSSGLDNISWNHGFAHPLEGWDHLITMLAVGIWAAQLRGHAVWLLPLAFVGVMSLGGIAGAAGFLLPAVEGVILLSCVVFSIFIVRRVRFSSRVNVIIVAFFAFFHGFAHGQEISASSSLISYTVGFMLATLLLHGAGILAAKLLLFCITCLVAVLLPSLAQAGQAQLLSKGHDKITPFIQQACPDKKSSFHKTIDHFYSGPERITNDDFYPDDKVITGIIPHEDNSVPEKLKERTRPFSFAQTAIAKSEPINKVNSNVSAFKQTAHHAIDGISPYRLLITQDFRPDFLVGFKHFFPDINYTPGQVLLSNGAGLTSPPLFPLNRTPVYNPQRFNNSPISSFEDRVLQITYADFTVGDSMLISIIGQCTSKISKPYLPIFRNLFDLAGKTVLSAYLISSLPFNCFANLAEKDVTGFRPKYNSKTFALKVRSRLNGEFLYPCNATLREKPC